MLRRFFPCIFRQPTVAAPSGAAFPTTSNLVLRWKASSVTGVLDGGLLTASVSDLSTAANHGLISASGVRWYATAANGKPSFGQTDPAATGKILATNNTSYANVTLCMVHKFVANQSGGDPSYNGIFGKEGAYGIYSNNSSGALTLSNNSSGVDRGTTLTDTSAFKFVAIRAADGVGSGSDIKFNNVLQGTTFTWTIRDQLVKFGLFDVAGYNTASYIPEIWVFDKILTDPELLEQFTYAAAEYTIV